MSLVLLSKQDDYDLTHSEQDCRGWTVRDAEGTELGKVADLIVDTEAEHIASLVLDSGAKIRAADVALRDGGVFLRDGGATTGGAGATASAAAGASVSASRSTDQDERPAGDVVLPVIEEQMRVGKREVDRGGVRVEQRVTETPVEASVRLREEHVTVERRPVDRPVAGTGADAFREGVMEITESAEEAVISKRARVVEEVVVGKDVTERDEIIRDTVKRTDVDVEQLGIDASENRTRFDDER